MPTSILDSREELAKIDEENVLGSIEALADQVRHAWESVQDISFSPTSEIRNVVIAGMGGSGLGADVIKTLFKEQLGVPFDFVHDYSLPGYVDQHTLVVLASYSGTTEEILSCGDEAQRRKAQIMIIASGGDLEKLAKEHNYPAYIIDPKHNPSGQPRMAIGYAVFGTLGLLSKAGVIKISESEVEEVITAIIATGEKNNPDVPQDDNLAKNIAFMMIDRRPVLVAAEFLEGAVHVSTNQFNENSKMFVDYKVVPEINHHLLEGLAYPKSNATNHLFVFINTQLYHKRNQARMKLTQDAVERNEIDTTSIELTMSTKLTQVWESIALFAYANFYVAMLENINPAPIPTVDWFKDELKKV